MDRTFSRMLADRFFSFLRKERHEYSCTIERMFALYDIWNRVDEQDHPAQLTSFEIFTTLENIRDNVNGNNYGRESHRIVIDRSRDIQGLLYRKNNHEASSLG